VGGLGGAVAAAETKLPTRAPSGVGGTRDSERRTMPPIVGKLPTGAVRVTAGAQQTGGRFPLGDPVLSTSVGRQRLSWDGQAADDDGPGAHSPRMVHDRRWGGLGQSKAVPARSSPTTRLTPSTKSVASETRCDEDGSREVGVTTRRLLPPAGRAVRRREWAGAAAASSRVNVPARHTVLAAPK